MSSVAVFMILGGATAVAATKIGANQLKANSVKTGKIVKEAVTAGKIKKSAVNESRLADAAVTTNKLADNAVTAPKIGKDAVTNEKIANDAVNNAKLANDAVNTAKLANGAVTNAKLGAGAVNRTNLAEANLMPRAYAFVNSAGTANAAFSSGMPNATRPETGTYCFNLPFAPVHAQATGSADGEADDVAGVSLAGASGVSGCPAGTDVKVEVLDVSAEGTPVNEAFYLVVW